MQHIVTKSSTDVKLVGMSESAAQVIHLRFFLMGQGYAVSHAITHQNNISSMALMKRGGPGLERSHHINIRHFLMVERAAAGDVTIKHLSTDLMLVNTLTKAVQGAQFQRERPGLTNWV